MACSSSGFARHNRLHSARIAAAGKTRYCSENRFASLALAPLFAASFDP